MAPITAAAMSSVPRDKAGVGSAVLNSMRQVGGSLGIAIMGAIVAAARDHDPGRRRTPTAFLTGFHHALEVAAVIALAGAVIAALTLRKVHHPEPAPGQAPQAAPPLWWRRNGVSATADRPGPARTRLSAEDRRQAVLDTACRVFFETSYRGATTAEIAREAGITEPILYRHFGSKRDLYLACLDEAWRSSASSRSRRSRRTRPAASARSPTPTWRSARSSGSSTSGSRR